MKTKKIKVLKCKWCKKKIEYPHHSQKYHGHCRDDARKQYWKKYYIENFEQISERKREHYKLPGVKEMIIERNKINWRKRNETKKM